MSPVNKFPFMPRALSQLIESFRLLPGIGPKTAQKLAFSTLGELRCKTIWEGVYY